MELNSYYNLYGKKLLNTVRTTYQNVNLLHFLHKEQQITLNTFVYDNLQIGSTDLPLVKDPTNPIKASCAPFQFAHSNKQLQVE